MKRTILLLVILVLPFTATAMESKALRCTSLSIVENEGKTYLLYPQLLVMSSNGFDEILYMALDGDQPEVSFGDVICGACGWGTAHTQISLRNTGDKQNGPFAYFNSKGELTKISLSDESEKLIDSLTCAR